MDPGTRIIPSDALAPCRNEDIDSQYHKDTLRNTPWGLVQICA
jgi:hypothetical protein